MLVASSQKCEIMNCIFIRCGSSMDSGSLCINKNAQQVTMEDYIFDGGSIDSLSGSYAGQGVAIYISNIDQFTISSSVNFINQKC